MLPFLALDDNDSAESLRPKCLAFIIAGQISLKKTKAETQYTLKGNLNVSFIIA